MTELQNEKIRVIEDTFDYYITHRNPRGFDDEHSTCVYRADETGGMCAVGRLLSKDALKYVTEVRTDGQAINAEDLIYELEDKEIIPFRKEISKELTNSANFWTKLQHYHDHLMISEKAVEHKDNIIKLVKDGEI
ncbi:MAG: hypothetical protein GY827_04625 [Cytophagales bacterium]|nr:hypothetical protein [Cytophagales bacterium]